MKILCHHIYEYKKGLRNLVLHTFHAGLQSQAEEKLAKNNIPYIIRKINKTKVNVFFGAKECVEVIESFGNKSLSEFNYEEDFILGIMLGYSRIEQCRRYIKKKYGRYINSLNSGYQEMSNYREVLTTEMKGKKFA